MSKTVNHEVIRPMQIDGISQLSEGWVSNEIRNFTKQMLYASQGYARILGQRNAKYLTYKYLGVIWDEYYACLDCYIASIDEFDRVENGAYLLEGFQTPSWNSYRLIGKDEKMNASDVVSIIQKLNGIAKLIMPEITIYQTYDYCANPDCPHSKELSPTRDAYHKVPKFMTVNVGQDQWICDGCAKDLSVTADVQIYLPIGSNVSQRNSKIYNRERSKMTKALRWKILSRDNFACRACGRNPREHKVVLQVDHIQPIAKGGKTVESNLHTLCGDCNRSKSDKIVNQMELWGND